MARYAPLVTLGAVAALGGALLFANSFATPGPGPGVDQASALAAPAPDEASPAPVAPVPAAPEAAPGAEPAVAERAFAGRSAGNEVTVAIAVKDGRAVGYVCDGKEIEAWLEGTLSGSTLSLSGVDDTTTITATVTEDASLGAVTVAGTERPFSAEGVTAPAGLYEGRADVRGVATRIGWIVDDNGAVTGVANAGGQRRPAPVLDPADPDAVTIDGAPVAVTALDGGDTVIRR